MGNFKVDLKKGNFSEKRLAVLLKKRGNEILTFNNDKGYDFSFKDLNGNVQTVEVKTDYMYPDTGNVAIEYKCNGK